MAFEMSEASDFILLRPPLRPTLQHGSTYLMNFAGDGNDTGLVVNTWTPEQTQSVSRPALYEAFVSYPGEVLTTVLVPRGSILDLTATAAVGLVVRPWSPTKQP